MEGGRFDGVLAGIAEPDDPVARLLAQLEADLARAANANAAAASPEPEAPPRRAGVADFAASSPTAGATFADDVSPSPAAVSPPHYPQQPSVSLDWDREFAAFVAANTKPQPPLPAPVRPLSEHPARAEVRAALAAARSPAEELNTDPAGLRRHLLLRRSDPRAALSAASVAMPIDEGEEDGDNDDESRRQRRRLADVRRREVLAAMTPDERAAHAQLTAALDARKHRVSELRARLAASSVSPSPAKRNSGGGGDPDTALSPSSRVSEHARALDAVWCLWLARLDAGQCESFRDMDVYFQALR